MNDTPVHRKDVLLNAAAILLASGKYTVESAIIAALELEKAVTARLKAGY